MRHQTRGIILRKNWPQAQISKLFSVHFKIKNELVKIVHTSSAVLINMAFNVSFELSAFFTANNVIYSMSFITKLLTWNFTSFSFSVRKQSVGKCGEATHNTIKVTYLQKCRLWTRILCKAHKFLFSFNYSAACLDDATFHSTFLIPNSFNLLFSAPELSVSDNQKKLRRIIRMRKTFHHRFFLLLLTLHFNPDTH